MPIFKGIIDSPGRSEKNHAFEVPDGETPIEGQTPPLCDRKKRRLVRLIGDKPVENIDEVTCGVCRFTVEKRKKVKVNAGKQGLRKPSTKTVQENTENHIEEPTT